jgi:uncharacterized protein YegL
VTDTDNSPATQDDQYLILAFYIIIDVSYSMKENGAIEAANKLLPSIMDAIAENPTLGDLVRVGVMDFSDDFQIVVPLGDLRSVEHVPELTVRAGTSFAAAFRGLRREIESDIAQLKGDGFKVFRPAVFFITDGAPTDEHDDLSGAFAELTAADFRARPNIIPFGLGAATKDVLDPWVFPQGRMRSFAARDGAEPGKALAGIGEILVGSIIASANALNEDGESGGFKLPDEDELSDWI